MNLLHLISSTHPSGGGPIEGVKQLYPRLNELGAHVELACCDPPDAPWLAALPVPPHALGPARGNYHYTPRLGPWLETHARRFDAVIINGLWQYHGLAAHRVLTRLGVPYFVFTHGMLDPWFKRTYPLKHLKKWLYWPWAEYRVLRDAKAVIFTCEEERILARQSFWLYRANEVVTHYGTAPPTGDPAALAAAFRARHPALADKRCVLFLSRIHEKKGCDLLIEAFAKVFAARPQWHLIMAGPDQTGWRAALESLARQRGIETRITWPGMLQGEDKWGAYHASEVFCLPSHQENFGIVVAEALACGKPVLISNKVNIWREIEGDGAGFVADDTVAGTAANLQRWVEMEEAQQQHMRDQARLTFETRFHIHHAAARLLEIIHHLA